MKSIITIMAVFSLVQLTPVKVYLEQIFTGEGPKFYLYLEQQREGEDSDLMIKEITEEMIQIDAKSKDKKRDLFYDMNEFTFDVLQQKEKGFDSLAKNSDFLSKLILNERQEDFVYDFNLPQTQQCFFGLKKNFSQYLFKDQLTFKPSEKANDDSRLKSYEDSIKILENIKNMSDDLYKINLNYSPNLTNIYGNVMKASI